tara:strand:+ start:100 stop:645 length:546 start_codon:yes stop_codon:yes gene_type:complete
MGACLRRIFHSKIKTAMAIKKLDQVSKLLGSMASRYKSEMNAIEINKEMSKSQIYNKLRRRKMIEKSLINIENKIAVCFQKRLLLESLEVTKMQIKALKKSQTAIKGFMNLHDQDKIEELTDKLEEMTQSVMDISNIINTTDDDIDIDEEELLLELNTMLPDVPTTTPVVTPTATKTALAI